MLRFIGQLSIAFTVTFSANLALAADVPRRAISLNVCTDQLAILLAKPGQLHSVSFLASDPKSSLLHKEAKAYVPNHGLAEEIFLMRPDLILAGTYTTRSTVLMLRRLGFRVEEFAPENSIAEVKASIKRMGTLFGTEDKANRMIAEIDKRLHKLQLPAHAKPTAAFYYSNSYTSGDGTLVSDIARVAGTANLAEKIGLFGTAYLSLENLLLSKPDLIVANEIREESPALAQQNFHHPAYRQLLHDVKNISIDGRLTACGTPFTIDAIEQLNAAVLQISMAKQ